MATPEHSVVKTLEKMVEYQDGSVVSKTVIGKKTGTVTLFAFDAGQSLSEHTAPFDALVVPPARPPVGDGDESGGDEEGDLHGREQ